MKVSKEGLGLIGFAAIGVTAISAQYAPGDVHLPIRAFEDARGGAADYRPIDCLPTPAATGTRSRQEQAIKCAETGEQHRLATNDLIQQTRAADAAAAQTTLAAQSVRLSFVQTLAAFLTLVAAAAAALYARRAAIAAKDTFDLDKAVSANVDRPWLSLSITIASDLALVDGKKTTFKVDVNVENIGNQPALMSLPGWKCIAGRRAIISKRQNQRWRKSSLECVPGPSSIIGPSCHGGRSW